MEENFPSFEAFMEGEKKKKGEKVEDGLPLYIFLCVKTMLDNLGCISQSVLFV